MKLSVIVPTFNEEKSIAKTLDALLEIENIHEVIIADGGSSDNTNEIAGTFQSVKLIKCNEANRGKQLNAGASAAAGDALWFVHADTIPPKNAAFEIEKALADEKTIGGNFEIIFGGGGRPARVLSRLYPHLRKMGLIYGDSAIFVRREIYQQAGGFRDLPLFEDVEFYKKLKKHGRFVHLKATVETSARRFQRRSFIWTFAKWSIFQGLYWLGFPPRILAKGYKAIR